MRHVFLVIVEECWVGHDYEGFASSQYIEYGAGAWTTLEVMDCITANENTYIRTCVAYDQIGCVVLLVETRFESPHVDIHSVLAHVPLSTIRRAELVHLRVAALYDNIGVALLSESVEHRPRKRSVDERIESR